MIQTVHQEREDRVISRKTPFLSYSKINRYLLCPEQYRLYYVEHLRPKFPSANLVFGQVLHQALASLFQTKGDPVKFFREAWNEVRQIDLTYGKKDSWEKLLGTGEGLLEKFLIEELPKLGSVHASEKVFELSITSLDLPFVGVIDLVADVEGKRTVADFKTSASAYQDHEVVLSDQLTAYQLAEPDAQQTALCVLVKTKEPRIEWHHAQRTSVHFTEFLAKARLVGGEISGARFYKRPGMWCAWCDFLPVCLGDTKRASEALVQIR